MQSPFSHGVPVDQPRPRAIFHVLSYTLHARVKVVKIIKFVRDLDQHFTSKACMDKHLHIVLLLG